MIIMICLRGKEWIRHWGPHRFHTLKKIPNYQQSNPDSSIRMERGAIHSKFWLMLTIYTGSNQHEAKLQFVENYQPIYIYKLKHDSTMFIWIWYDMILHHTIHPGQQPDAAWCLNISCQAKASDWSCPLPNRCGRPEFETRQSRQLNPVESSWILNYTEV